MNIIRALCLFTLLGIFPAASYYYLNTGMNFRKEILDELTIKASLQSWLDSRNVDLSVAQMCLGHISLVVFRKSARNDKNIGEVLKQFDSTESFQAIILNHNVAPLNWDSDKLTQQNGFHNFDGTALIVDEKAQIRNEYSLNASIMKDLVQHLAVSIPLKKQKDIKMRKSTSQ